MFSPAVLPVRAWQPTVTRHTTNNIFNKLTALAIDASFYPLSFDFFTTFSDRTKLLAPL
jgi:hypothetical protein